MKSPVDYVKSLTGLGKEVWEKLGGADAYIQQERNLWQEEVDAKKFVANDEGLEE